MQVTLQHLIPVDEFRSNQDSMIRHVRKSFVRCPRKSRILETSKQGPKPMFMSQTCTKAIQICPSVLQEIMNGLVESEGEKCLGRFSE